MANSTNMNYTSFYGLFSNFSFLCHGSQPAKKDLEAHAPQFTEIISLIKSITMDPYMMDYQILFSKFLSPYPMLTFLFKNMKFSTISDFFVLVRVDCLHSIPHFLPLPFRSTPISCPLEVCVVIFLITICHQLTMTSCCLIPVIVFTIR